MWPLPHRSRFLPLVFILLFWTLALHTARVKSPTVDESVHLLRGQTLWQTADLRFQFEHAPLAHWLIGSLLFTEPTLAPVTELPSWESGDRILLSQEWLWQMDPLPEIARAFFLGRFPIICLGLLLGALLARWGRKLAGAWGQLLLLVLWAFSPNLLAHFSLGTTDGPLTAVYVAAVLTLASLARHGFLPSPRQDSWLARHGRTLIAGTTLGLALGTKLTALLLLPLALLLLFIAWWRATPRPGWQRPLRLWLSLLPLAGLVVWTLYGFEWRALPGGSLPLPAATYFNSGWQLLTHVEGGHITYLLGERSTSGWWYYFLVAFLVKTPAITLLLLLAALGWGLRQRRAAASGDSVTWFLLLPPLALFAVASYSRFDIGYRHILPVLPFVWLLLARPAVSWCRNTIARILLGMGLTWYAFATLQQHPHHLAYFNEWVGGPANGIDYLGDSNLDWGQDLYQLLDYAADSDEPVAYSYFGSVDPVALGLAARPLLSAAGAPQGWAPANPAAGRYALSASHLQGLWLAEPDAFDWFRRQTPLDDLGYSIRIYDVPAAAVGTWVAYCLDPGPLLDPVAVADLIGEPDTRSVFFDCHNSWVFPQNGVSGWYILPQRASWPAAAHFPNQLRAVYTHAPTTAAPSYEVYYWDGDLDSWLAGLAGTATQAYGASLSLPAPAGDALRLMGYVQEDTDWWTVWQVQALPTPATLTIAGHLYTEAPIPLVADGAGFSSEQWQVGDLFWQRHAYGEHGRYLETGVYDYLSGARQADFIRLIPVAPR